MLHVSRTAQRTRPVPRGSSHLMTHGGRGHMHVVGIGGIGTSALAQWLLADSWTVTGTDAAASDITDALARQGIPVTIGNGGKLPRGTTRLLYSDAVPEGHPLRAAARSRGIAEVSYAELLGELTAPFKTIAISGSHGKSTTSALVGWILERAGLDPTVALGTRLLAWTKNSVGNFRRGCGPIAVVEADEYRKHFGTLAPFVAVVTSVDHDHVDAFPTPASYAHAFAEFLARLRAQGTVVFSAIDPATPRLRRAVPTGATVWTVGNTERRGSHVVASLTRVRNHCQEFRLRVAGKAWGTFTLAVPGAHNVANAALAVAAVLPFSVPQETIREALATFPGTWRRFEQVGEMNGAPVISDYAHHPTELRALAAAARQCYPDRRLVIAFQPHQRARTRAFGPAFVEALQLYDTIILSEIYDVAGREDPSDRTTSRDWVGPLHAAGKPVTFASTLADTEKAIRTEARVGDIILVVGAGDIDAVARRAAQG